MARGRSSEILGGFLERAEVSRPSRPPARGSVGDGSGAQSRRRERQRILSDRCRARVFRNLDRIKPHIKAWYYDNSQAQQLMEQEEVDLIAMMNGRATESILNAKAPFEIVWNEAICEGGVQGWIAPVGCPNPKGAMKFLDIVGRREHQAVFARLMYYAPQNPKALDLLEPAIARLMPTYPDNEKVAHMINFDCGPDNPR